MVRLTRKVFSDLAIWMIGLGLFIGVLFPLFLVQVGFSRDLALSPWFFGATMSAGFLVGGANIWLAKAVVGNRLRALASHMRHVESNLTEGPHAGDGSQCSIETCCIPVDSEDEIGESSTAFNYLVHALAASNQNMEALRSFSAMLASQLDLEVMVNKALHLLLQYTEGSAGALLIAAEGEITLAASEGIRTPGQLVNSDHVRRAMQSESRLCVLVPEDVVVEGVLTDFRPREVVINPILYKGVPLGVIVLASSTGFGDAAKSRLEPFCQALALALNNALTYDRLQRLAALDPLTNIYNRRFGMARLQEEFSRAVRNTGPLGILMFDIDHFKKVNDTYGHLAGDRVLIQVAKIARAALRDGDILMRYGGEEFLILLPAASKENARDIAERLRRMVEESSVSDGDQEIRVTVSVGVTSFPEFTVNSQQDLVKRADELLYSAKETGRNRVVAG
jgi:diguanylate cyclase (GGDEF)-like protein